MSNLTEKIKNISPWHFVWGAVVVSEVSTAVSSLVQSYLKWGYIPADIMIIGAIDALFAPLLIVPGLIYLVSKISKLQQELESRKEVEKEIRYLAYYDNLTNLPNRTLFKELLERAIATANRHNYVMAILFIDLDFFKRINDTLGHDVGDKLLQAVRDRLLNSTRSSDYMSRAEDYEQKDVVSRLGGDEFILLLHNLASLNDPGRVAVRIINDMSKSFNVEGHEVYITASIGISIYPDDGKTVEDMIKNADVAMYHAKAKGRNNYQYYSKDLTSVAVKYLTMEYKLRRALDNNEFLLYYQPKYSVNGGVIIGLEALLRWKPEDSDLVTPSQFISILEEGGLIMPVGDWVLRTACSQNKAWQEAGYEPTIVSVNLSSRQFDQKDLIDIVTSALQAAGLHPKYLELEITESTVMKDPEAAIITLNKLKNMGVRISIDDFGTGYSSLTYLKQIPLDFIKIDRSFIEHVIINPSDQAIVKAIVALAHSLDLRVIAEGVETEEQLMFLRGCGCDHVQGYLLSRPLAVHQTGELFLSAEPGLAVS
ncbi:MAG TPA: EAL domain-containing protein [Dissulfurispiraceae bacterium]|nr:EAL domain-containing protein [Dissulfurispiraceae bacterium]